MNSILVLLIVFFWSLISPMLINTIQGDVSDCIFIGSYGGGYSGFWYYYGQIQKEYILDKKMYCFSAGCLAPVASIQHNNYDNLINIAYDLQKKYINNEIDRFDVRNEFIYKLANKETNIYYYDLNILTSNYFGNCTIVRPKTKNELIDALNQTTNIPFITSRLDILQNIDGGLCMNNYPSCKKKIRMPLTYKFITNILNLNMKKYEIEYFMNY